MSDSRLGKGETITYEFTHGFKITKEMEAQMRAQGFEISKDYTVTESKNIVFYGGAADE